MAHPAPDSPVAARVFPSPNHGERRDGRRPDMLVLHYTNMPSAGEALQWLCNPLSEVSAHYFVFEDGHVVQMVPEARRAWHAGRSAWGRDADINSCSIGVEIANAGHLGGLPPYPQAQIEAVIRLGLDVAGRWNIPAIRVLAHSDVAPDRKQDPGKLFPWDSLAAAGLGHIVPPSPVRDGRFFARGDAGQPVEALQAMFALYGYALPVTGVYDQATHDVVAAFQRHFRRARVDGVADASTITTLRDLLAARPSPSPAPAAA